MKQAGKVIVRYNQLDHVRHQLYSNGSQQNPLSSKFQNHELFCSNQKFWIAFPPLWPALTSKLLAVTTFSGIIIFLFIHINQKEREREDSISISQAQLPKEKKSLKIIFAFMCKAWCSIQRSTELKSGNNYNK